MPSSVLVLVRDGHVDALRLAVLDLSVDPMAAGRIGQYGLSMFVVKSAGSSCTGFVPWGRLEELEDFDSPRRHRQ